MLTRAEGRGLRADKAPLSTWLTLCDSDTRSSRLRKPLRRGSQRPPPSALSPQPSALALAHPPC